MPTKSKCDICGKKTVPLVTIHGYSSVRKVCIECYGKFFRHEKIRDHITLDKFITGGEKNG